MSRNSITHLEKKTFTFKLTDSDVLRIAGELTALKSEELGLERKRSLIANNIKKVKTQMVDKLDHIANREEPREVECEVVFDYQERMVRTTYLGEIMESRPMSDWEFSCRPEDVLPAVKASSENSDKDRAEEIAEKTANLTAQSGDVNQKHENHSETSVLNV